VGSEHNRVDFLSGQWTVSSAGLKSRSGPVTLLPNLLGASRLELAKAGKKEEAKTRLRSILEVPNLETRHTSYGSGQLCANWGSKPNANSGKEILGVVIEVPMHGAYETLAGYQDGSARYLNFSGKAIFWDKPDGSIKLLCERLICLNDPGEFASRLPRKDTVLSEVWNAGYTPHRSGMYVVAEHHRASWLPDRL